MKIFKDFIENKKIIIIGPASYLKQNPIADKIDEFDTIIRVNSSIDLVEKIPHIVGEKTDIVHATVAVDPSTNTNHRKIDFWIKKEIKHLRISPPGIKPSWLANIRTFEELNRNRLDYSIVNPHKYMNYVKECRNTIPNTGFTAILDCLEYNPEQVHISGITFFKGGYMSEYGISSISEKQVRELFSRVQNHDIDEQINFFRKIYKERKITCDNFIKESLGL